jgi:hypothetical protein
MTGRLNPDPAPKLAKVWRRSRRRTPSRRARLRGNNERPIGESESKRDLAVDSPSDTLRNNRDWITTETGLCVCARFAGEIAAVALRSLQNAVTHDDLAPHHGQNGPAGNL